MQTLHRSSTRISSRERLPSNIEPETTHKHFALSPPDIAEIHLCRGAINKLSFGNQLCCLRWFGYLLPDMKGVPESVKDAIGEQLSIQSNVDISPYPQSEDTRTEHGEGSVVISAFRNVVNCSECSC